ncbi:MAG: flagellar export chaperone FliS [Oceanococcaceae bacterium]
MYASTYSNQSAAWSYQSVDVQTASPARLTALLFTNLDARLAHAGRLAGEGQAEAGVALMKALDILAELQGTLNLAQGGEIAANLYALYQYIALRLRQSDDRAAAITEVRMILAPLVSAWSEIAEGPAAAPRAGARMVA